MKRDLDTDLRTVLRTDAGRAVLASLLAHTNLEGPGFTGDHSRDIFDSGRRSVGLYLASWIKGADFEAYIQLLRETRDNG